MKPRLSASRLAAVICLLGAVSIAPAANPGPKTPPKLKRKCTEQGSGTSSFYWYLDVGNAFYPAADDFLMNFRYSVSGGQNLGDFPPTLDQVMSAYYGGSVTNRSQVTLQVETPSITAANLNPASLNYNQSATVETVKSGDTLRQIVTDDTFVDIVPQTVGFVVRIYDIAHKSGTKTGGVYTLTGAVNPFYETTFTTHNGAAYSNTLQLVSIDRRGSGPRVEFKRFITNTVADTVTEETYVGSLSGSTPVIGTKVEEITATYSDRGARPYDYTLVRETKRASVTATTAGIVSYGSLTVVDRTLDQYGDFSLETAGGDARYKRLLKHIDGYGSTEPRETVYTWYDQTSNEHIHGRLKTVIRPDKSWEFYTYTDSPFSSTAQEIKYEGWKGQLYNPADLANAKKTVTSITGSGGYVRTVSIAGQTVSQEKKTYLPDSGGVQLKTERKIGSLWQEETTFYHAQSGSALLAGKPKWTLHADGTYTTYAYATVSGNLQVVERTGAGTSSSISSGTQTTRKYNKWNEQISEEVRDIASNLVLNSWLATSVDAVGRPLSIVYNADPDDYEEFQYHCCGLGYHRTRDASIDHRTFDHFRRQVFLKRDLYDGDPGGAVTITAYDGLTSTTTTEALVMSSTTRKLNGETASAREADRNGDGTPEQTTYSYNYPVEGGKIVTAVDPLAGQKMTTYFADGQVKSVTGSAVPDVAYDYGTHAIDGGGRFTLTTRLSATAGTDEWEKTYFDSLGRPFRTEYPTDWDGNSQPDAATTTYYLPSAIQGRKGKPYVRTDADGVAHTVTYDTRGRIATEVVAMPDSQNRTISYAYNVAQGGVVPSGWGPYRRTQVTVNGTLVETTLTSGSGDWTRTDTLGKITIQEKTVPTAAGNSTETVTRPDGTKDVSIITGNRLTKRAWQNTTGGEIWSVSYTHDILGRVTSSTDSRTGTTSFMMNGSGNPVAYDATGAIPAYTASGNLLGQRDPGGRIIKYSYDALGRRTLVDAPDSASSTGSTLSNITRTSYDAAGRVKAVWGDQTYATYRKYDEQGRLTQLRTYRSLAHGNEPVEGTPGYDQTTWIYDGFRGLLTQKRDDANKGADYTYTPAGRLKTRQWARSDGGGRLTTTYDYDAGLLVVTGYSDGTPDVAITYDAFGRQTEVVQQNQSKIAYAYDPATLAVDTETVSYDLDHDGVYEFVRMIDRKPLDAKGREMGWQLKNGSSVHHEVTYGYDGATGRLDEVDGGDLGTFTYTYVADSAHLIAGVNGPVHSVINTWDTTRDALLAKENKAGVTTVSKYGYGVNAIGQRTAVSLNGVVGASGWSWGYDAKGQVVKADSSASGQDRAYEYDEIGNRKKSAESLILPGSDNYTANALNQYTAINSLNPTYDDDGNATSYPLPGNPGTLSNLSWDGENRLVTVQVGTTTRTYYYDALGRRFGIKTQTGSIVSKWVLLYDGWNVIAEYNNSLQLARTYAWGLELRGSLQGAGGVGGLLAMCHEDWSSDPVSYPTYDGNGNVSEYLNASGAVAVRFVYDPFGNTVVNTDVNESYRYRFSTKPVDGTTGFYYYGYRYYDPVTGKWPSRDIIEEEGGVNLYEFVGNDGVNNWDYLGSRPDRPWPPIPNGKDAIIKFLTVSLAGSIVPQYKAVLGICHNTEEGCFHGCGWVSVEASAIATAAFVACKLSGIYNWPACYSAFGIALDKIGSLDEKCKSGCKAKKCCFDDVEPNHYGDPSVMD